MKYLKLLGLGSLVLALLLSMVALGFGSTLAQDGGANLPTPTSYPVEEVAYELSIVGGEDVTFTFAGTTAEGITVGETSVNSDYPRGMVFTTTAESENGSIQSATLWMIFPTGGLTRFEATMNAETKEWTANPWSAGEGIPAWRPFSFYWRVRDETDVAIDTEPIAISYWDPTREWYRAEGDYLILYWFGADEVDPEYIAENAMYAMNTTEPRRIAGFGSPISYKPVGVLYPTRETLGEFSGSGTSNDNAAGYTSSEMGMTVQNMAPPTDAWFERQADCVYATPREERISQAFIVDRSIFGTIPHEVAHLYQYDHGVAVGPNWWVEGQADYFTYQAGQYDFRIRNLATFDSDIPTIDGNIGAFTYEADGCYALAYDMGVSFINWLLSTYGGIETHAQIVSLLQSNMTLNDVLEEATGKPFYELENEWRVYLGYEPFSDADRDPSLLMAEAVDPLFAVGDTFTVPGPRPMTLYENAGPNQMPSSAACFAGIQGEVLRSGSLEGANYYEVDCSGLKGWVEESQLPLP